MTLMQRDELYMLAAKWCQANAEYFAGEASERNRRLVQETGEAFMAALDKLVRPTHD